MKQKIIVLSAYEDYSLVRTAFKFGVSDYILKTEIEGEKLLELLNTVIDKIALEKNTIGHDPTGSISQDVKDRILKELLFEEWEKLPNYDLSGLRIAKENIIVCSILIDDFTSIEERYTDSDISVFIDSVLNTVRPIIDALCYGEMISLSADEYVLLFSMKEAGVVGFRKNLDFVLKEIKKNIFSFLNSHITIGVSRPGDGFEQIHSLFMQAKKNAGFRFFFGKHKTIYPEDVELIDFKDNLSIIPVADKFIDALKAADEKAVMEELDHLLEHINTNKTSIDNMMIYYTEIIFILIKVINDYGGDVTAVFGKDVNFYEQIRKFETSQEIDIWIKNLSNWVVCFLADKKDVKISFIMRKALSFIKENYRDENIAVWMVSNYLGLSESYFSTLFKKEIGETFTNYLTNLRIEDAKRLMRDTNMKMYEICDYIGYNNVEHFSRLFKKVTGSSPNNYKKQYLL